jgi:hypothetical protein
VVDGKPPHPRGEPFIQPAEKNKHTRNFHWFQWFRASPTLVATFRDSRQTNRATLKKYPAANCFAPCQT